MQPVELLPMKAAFGPLMLNTLAVCAVMAVFYAVCVRLLRRRQAAWESMVASNSAKPTDSLDARLGAALIQRSLVGRGSPVDRLFIGVAAAVSAGALLYLGAFLLGVTPASSEERALLATLRGAVYTEHPRVAVALRAVDEGLYVSKQDVRELSRVALQSLRASHQ